MDGKIERGYSIWFPDGSVGTGSDTVLGLFETLFVRKVAEGVPDAVRALAAARIKTANDPSMSLPGFEVSEPMIFETDGGYSAVVCFVSRKEIESARRLFPSSRIVPALFALSLSLPEDGGGSAGIAVGTEAGRFCAVADRYGVPSGCFYVPGDTGEAVEKDLFGRFGAGPPARTYTALEAINAVDPSAVVRTPFFLPKKRHGIWGLGRRTAGLLGLGALVAALGVLGQSAYLHVRVADVLESLDGDAKQRYVEVFGGGTPVDPLSQARGRLEEIAPAAGVDDAFCGVFLLFSTVFGGEHSSFVDVRSVKYSESALTVEGIAPGAEEVQGAVARIMDQGSFAEVADMRTRSDGAVVFTVRLRQETQK